MHSNKVMIFEGLLAIIIFAFVPVAIKFTAATPITICLFRLLITVSVLAVFWRKKIDFKSFIRFGNGNYRLWLIGLIFFFHWVTYAYGVKFGGASIGTLGLSTYGMQLVLASILFLGHKITKKDVLCLSLSMFGILMIIPSWNFNNESTKGLILSLLSATCFALLPIMHRKSQNFSLETRIFAQFFGALVGFSFFISKTHWNLQKTDWYSLIFLGVFGTLIAHSLWARVSAKALPLHSGLAYYSIAPIAIVIAHFFLGESFTQLQFSGCLVVIVAALINIVL
jgi:drug/metabolite transporter (DMT)-like permease